MIATNFLKAQGVKLKVARKRKLLKYDSKAYGVGKEDAKKIDLKRKAIEERTDAKRAKKDGGHVLKSAPRKATPVKKEVPVEADYAQESEGDPEYDSDGDDSVGFDEDWRDNEGFNLEGYDASGYDREGLDLYGLDRDGEDDNY